MRIGKTEQLVLDVLLERPPLSEHEIWKAVLDMRHLMDPEELHKAPLPDSFFKQLRSLEKKGLIVKHPNSVRNSARKRKYSTWELKE
jgi:DNA-binding PadR family transcriptional regulator